MEPKVKMNVVDPPNIPRKTVYSSDKYKVIQCTDYRFVGITDFYCKIEDAIRSGWTVWKEAPINLAPSVGAITSVTLIKEDVEIEEEKPIEEQVEALTGKADLLAKASELSIDVPEDKKQPAAIKKYILQELEKSEDKD